MEDEALDNLKYRENSQGPFVRRPISAKPGVKFNPGFSLLCSIFRSFNHQLVDKKS